MGKDSLLTFSSDHSLCLETNYLHQGLKTSQKEHFEKNSPTLGRTAQYEKNSTICRFPSYLTIQMMRMFYKVDTAKKAKIMRVNKLYIHT